jgi:methylthioribulose-1-phosphate dehydratase
MNKLSYAKVGRMAAIVWEDGLLRQAELLCEAAHRCSARGWVPATAGNFSFRDAVSGRIFITASGLDKGAILPADLLEIDAECRVLAGEGKPSAETSLHGVIYRRDAGAMAIFHVHSIWNTLLSDWFSSPTPLAARLKKMSGSAPAAVPLEGYELLKALSGVTTHAHRELVPILENSQDYAALAAELAARLREQAGAHGVLLRRHGLYTWGESIAGAWRHLEALEFLFEVEARRVGCAS